ncbi:hypothetical protein BDV33DRAFT_206061 [Aspergillus novoparasiticus]|uniref:FAD/NAD(P)-binding domain-containing protein n=1 Tax=Aspergillus novoparasiticus TaxID=986946 RepID=A0A5N6EJC0_9EURO|nr:hypothetical protein BDV33DRAFT_206061 [Aspergillus novoparasiticus]
MTASTDYDVLVIGAGPAGLAAATALGSAYRNFAVFDSQEYQLCRAAAVKDISTNYPTVTFIDTVVEIATATATAVNQMYKFQVTSTRGGHFRGKKLILATGSKDVFPNIPGYAELVHCLFCDGFEKNDSPAGAPGLGSLQDLASVLMAHHMSNKPLTIFLNGESPTREKDRKALRVAEARNCKVNHREIRLLSRNSGNGYVLVEFSDDSQC